MTKLEFKAEVRKAMTLKGWNYKELAEATGYTHGTIQTMMSDDDKLSADAMKKIAEVMGIKKKLPI